MSKGKDKTAKALLSISASQQKGDVIIKRVEFGGWRVELTANDKDKTTRAPLSISASQLLIFQKGDKKWQIRF
ncbi:MAG: hypothetical protein FWH43_05670 [Endomicrobia bacterium]|nr:hypothetical protein [Endomicrobiia bacterium]